MDYLKTALLILLGGTVGGFTLVEISPIKINPWKCIFGWIGKALNGPVLNELEEIKARMDKQEARMDKAEARSEEDKMETARIRILRFGDECKRKIKHGEEHFNQVLEDIDKYETYCATHPEFKNSKAVLTISRIKECYAERLEKGDFLV